MSEHLNNMVDAIVNNDGIRFKDEFNSAMTEVVAEKIQERKTQIAASLVAEPAISEEAEETLEYIQADGTRRKCKGGDGRRTDKDGNKINVKEEEVDEGSAEEYEKFFRAALKKFKVDSPADFKSDEEKKKFFDYVDKEYKGSNEED